MADEDLSPLIELARAEGATEEEIAEAALTGGLGDLASERSLYPRSELMSFEDAAAAAGVDAKHAARLWRALGFPDPFEAGTELSINEVEVLRIVAGVGPDLLGLQETEHVARVVGSSAARMAESLVDAFRLRYELPRHAAGVPYHEIVRDYIALNREMTPRFADALASVFQRHMVDVLRREWSVDEDRSAVTHDRVVGFADLVGYTEAATRLSTRELAAMVDGFEERVAGAVANHGGRVVKLIGDEAMFATETVEDACAVARDLIAEFGESLRVGMAAGSVITIRGDYYGPVVNLAHCLTGTAEPGTALVSQAVCEGAGDDFALEPVGPVALKGLDRPVPVYRLCP